MLILKNKSLTFISLALIVFGIVACSPQNILKTNTSPKKVSEPNQSPEVQKTIVLADISDNPQKKIRTIQPLADYLAANSDQFDLGKVKIARDMDTMIAWLKSGEVDLYIDSPYPAMLAMNGANAKPILRRWKKGNAEYYSVIFTMKDNNINSLSDLKGKIIAFEDPFSTTGYMLPLAKLIESGLNPIEKSVYSTQVSKEYVGYVFSYEDENSLEWLLSGKVEAAATDNQSFEKLSAEIKNKSLILAKTDKLARNLVMVREDMLVDQIEEISSILLAMDKTNKGKAVLKKFNKTTKFDKIPNDNSLNKIQDLYQKYQNK
ncbi:MAG: phosphate/phosphite/phosphonate ABC transporter substrate-binding protein [Prochloraceae cyanobacterium]|nr:phosphate/phosphite/phosphonate ABC transporter substrate-binding protein [Prochloraceae cyanobacterium]